MSKDTLCPTCLKEGKVSICKPTDDAFWECPNCRCGVWPPEDDPDMVKRERQQAEINNSCISRSFQPGTHVQGGGDSVGKSGKDKMRKKSLSQINSGLNGKCTSFDN